MLVGVNVAGRMGDGHEAARRARRHQMTDDVADLGVRDELQHGQQHDRDRLGEVQRPGRVGQDLLRVPQVGVEVVAGALRAALQERLGVRQHDGVVVDVDDPAVRRGALGDLVGVVRGRDPGADVEELPDPRLGGQEAHRPGQERAVGPHREHQVRVGLQRPLAECPVRREVVLAAQPVVVHAGDVRHADVKVGHRASLPIAPAETDEGPDCIRDVRDICDPCDDEQVIPGRDDLLGRALQRG